MVGNTIRSMGTSFQRSSPSNLVREYWLQCKLIQWVLPPRLILFGGIIVMGSIMQILDWPLALKWWALFLIMGVTLCLAIPDKLVDDRFKKSINKLPLLFIMMVVNLFRMKGMNKKFVNTEKNGSSTL